MTKPIAVLISDIHFTPATLELATNAFRQAQNKANQLKVKLIVAGDTLDTKAVVRAECANRLLQLLSTDEAPPTVFLVGNHELINERSSEHSLHFLKPYAEVIETFEIHPLATGNLAVLFPYYSNKEELKEIIKGLRNDLPVIMHQGLQSSNSGEYYQDKTALSYEDVADLRVISGHYHARQDIKTGRPQKGAKGLFSYIGNPYTTNFGEAKDPEKGYQVLYDDGTLEFVPTNLRKHVIFEMTTKDIHGGHVLIYNQEDLLWIKIHGTKEELSKLTRESVLSKLHIKASSVKLDFSPIDTVSEAVIIDTSKSLETQLDELIDISSTSVEQKVRLKNLWRSKT